MKWLTPRISFHRHKENYTTIIISTKIDKWKESLIFGWLILWSAIGIFMLYLLLTGNFSEKMLGNSSKQELQLYIIIFLLFWALFEFRVFRVYLWRKKGMEYFKITKEKLIIKKAFGKLGKANEYLIENISNFQLIQHKPNGFAQVMSGAFWDLGNETISFDYHNKKVIFGKQLQPAEAKKLLTFVKTEVKKTKTNQQKS